MKDLVICLASLIKAAELEDKCKGAAQVKYRVINLDWEKVLSFCSQLLLLTGLELVFFYSNMFDVFCIKILLV